MRAELALLDALGGEHAACERDGGVRLDEDPLRFSTSTATMPLLPALRSGLLRVMLVGLDDALHKLVPDDVLVAERDERDPVDRGEDVLNLDQPRRLIAWQVDLPSRRP